MIPTTTSICPKIFLTVFVSREGTVPDAVCRRGGGHQPMRLKNARSASPTGPFGGWHMVFSDTAGTVGGIRAFLADVLRVVRTQG